jgi:bisphosphoglycerate-dependent phosphoglycerate mutase
MGKDEFKEEIDFLNGRIEQLDKKKAGSDKEETIEDKANAYLADKIVEVLADGKKMLVSALITAINPEFMALYPSIFLSSQRVTHIVTALVKDETLKKTVEKSKSYYSLA